MNRRWRCWGMLGTACPRLEEVGKVGHAKGIKIGIVVGDDSLLGMRCVSWCMAVAL